MPNCVKRRSNTLDSVHCRGMYPQVAHIKRSSLLTTSPARKKRTTTNKEQSSGKTKTIRKSVAFGQSVHVQNVLHVSDYSSAEREATWYSVLDFAAIKQDTCKAVKNLETLGIRRCRQANPDFTSRGLEARTKEGARERIQNKLSARKVVLEKQKKDRGVCDPEHLALIYISESRHCQVIAHEIGLDDEYVARKQLRSKCKL